MTLDLNAVEVAEIVVALDRYTEALSVRAELEPQLHVRASLVESLADELADALIDAEGNFLEDPLEDA